jgi:hypothetical protein
MFEKASVFGCNKGMDQPTGYLRKWNNDPSFFEELGNLAPVVCIYRGDDGWMVILQRGYFGKVLCKVEIAAPYESSGQDGQGNESHIKKTDKPSQGTLLTASGPYLSGTRLIPSTHHKFFLTKKGATSKNG